MEVVPRSEMMFSVKALISTDLCDRILGIYHADSRKRRGGTVSGRGKNRLQNDIKLSTDLEIVPGGVWATAFNELNQAVNMALLDVVARVPSLQVWPLRWTGYKIQHYKQNEGFFRWHFDALGPGTWDRQMALIIYLNSVCEGGETSFHAQNLKVKPIAGDALLFPTFWTHTHCGEIPRSSDKYIVSSFISFAIPAADRKTA